MVIMVRFDVVGRRVSAGLEWAFRRGGRGRFDVVVGGRFEVVGGGDLTWLDGGASTSMEVGRSECL